MRKLIVALAIAAIPPSAGATPYFRIINPAHPQPVLGALIDTTAPGQTEAASLLPLVTHSPKDGCLFPTVICETWTPLAVGVSINSGNATLSIAPLFNVAPWAQSALEKSVSFVKDPAVAISFGPVWEYKQASNRGYFRIFAGLALNF